MIELAHGCEIDRGVPGCRCRLLPGSGAFRLVSGQDDCPVHGFGQGDSFDLEIDGRRAEWTLAQREVLPRERNGCDFEVPQPVLLRVYQVEPDTKELNIRTVFWVPGHKTWLGRGGDDYAPASMMIESTSLLSKYRMADIVEDAAGQRLGRKFLLHQASAIAGAMDLPKEAIELWAKKYSPRWTFYLLSGEAWDDPHRARLKTGCRSTE